jgi:hypothetical protein
MREKEKGMKIQTRFYQQTIQSANLLAAESLQVIKDLATVAAPPDSFTAPKRASATGMRDLMGLRKSKLSVAVA